MPSKIEKDVLRNLRSGLIVAVKDGDAVQFAGLLNAGFMVKIRAGEPVKRLLCDQLGLDQSYFDERVQTLFLNGKPVDDPASAVVKGGATLALSAAMPGLVGATFRKGGRYRWMRDSISNPDDSDVAAGRTGWITIKLFNLIQKELGPFFLEAGVWLEGETIMAFFSGLADSLINRILSVRWKDQEVSPGAVMEIEWPDAPVYIKIVSPNIS